MKKIKSKDLKKGFSVHSIEEKKLFIIYVY